MSDTEIIKEFLIESYENLDRLDQELIALEKDAANRETLASVFRTIHTIKGTSGFLAFNQLEAVTHLGENLLARLRDGQLVLTSEITTALLSMVDAVRQILGNIETTGQEGKRNDQELIDTLTRLLQNQVGNISAAAFSETGPPPRGLPKAPTELSNVPFSEDKANADDAAAAIARPNAGEPRRVEGVLVEHGTDSSPEGGATINGPHPPHGQSASESTIRVDVGQLDRLMNGMSELVLLRNQIVQYSNSTDDSELQGTSQRLNLLTTELQEGVMKTRMQPIGNIWSKFPRTVRDVALTCGKQVRIEMEGKETELDKTIIEAIKDPLTHLVRNAVDHGIESPETRRAAGKSPEGLLFLRAFHEGGQVNIEISDDGSGLDFEKIRNKAIQKALVSADQAARMTEREITNLIFLPGFSTAEKVTNVSGRGVGMDVVRTNIEKIGGTVDVQSRPARGSTVRMKIPLTLAIIPALIVHTGGDRYAIPQVSLLELVRLEGEQACNGVELVNGAPVHRLRGKLLPLVYLKRELKTEAANSPVSNQPQLDFSLARDQHRQWVEKIRQVMNGKLTMAAGEAGSHEKCELGKWIHSIGSGQLSKLSDTHLLEDSHRKLHQSILRVLTLKQEGNAAQASQEFAALELHSETITQLLAGVEMHAQDRESVNIVVLRADDRQFGLVVDEINDTEEIVVKPLSKQLKIINTYAGATIMGDGKVALILDVMGLAQRASVISEVRDRALVEKGNDDALGADKLGKHSAVLLFQYGESGRMAVDLALVARLEEFSRADVEFAGHQEVVQYRGQIMPLIRVSELLGGPRINSAQNNHESLQVVVYAQKGRSVGLVVDRILDIVEESLVMQSHTGRKGTLGSAVIQKRVTDILDVPGLIATAEQRQLLEANA